MKWLFGKFGSTRVPLHKPTKAQSILAGIEPTVEQLYQLCNSSINLIRSKGADHLGDVSLTISFIQKIQKTFKVENQFSAEALTTLSSAMNKIFKGADPEIDFFGDQCQHIFKSIIFKAMVRLLEKVPAGLRSPEELFFKAFALPLSIGAEGFDVNNIEPTVNAWIDLVFDVKEDLPIPISMKDGAEKEIRKKTSALVTKIYKVVTSWIVDSSTSEAELNDLFPSKNPLRVCRMIPHLVVEGIPYGIRENQDTMMKEIMPLIASVLPKGSDLGLMERIIKGFISNLGDNNSDDFKKVLEFIGLFSETAAIRFIGNVFNRIHQLEVEGIGQTSVLEDLMIGNLEIVKEHLNGINTAKKMRNLPLHGMN